MKRETHPNPARRVADRNRLSHGRADRSFVSERLESRVLLAAAAVSASIGAGAYPDGGIAVDANGNVFGTTTFGGANGFGTIFEIAHGSRNVTTLASFPGGQQATGNLVLDANGDLFGMTVRPPGEVGTTLFELEHGNSTITTLASNNNFGFSVFVGSIVRDGEGNILHTAAARSLQWRPSPTRAASPPACY
ncbi:MAG TPA: choice-of-anchor tandem repeat GloVer-containing protein [Tepidisphaeraceae bacterium]|nr:choice-of-anchor tandem repeat GloVer-containing protein [Tepidisphaeraceae bacterium]